VTPTHFAFAGRALLDTDARRLRAALDAIGERDEALERMSEVLAAAGQELEIEYVRLFLDPRGAPCSPWQSAHEEEGRLMGNAHQSARLWYARYGATPQADTEPADHAGLLLMFYAQMMAAGVEAQELSQFAQRHLSWIPAFAAKVSQEARHPLYSILGPWLSRITESVT
jgi:TorA maturation chaperone TorD